MYDIAQTHYPYAKTGRLEKWKTSNLEHLRENIFMTITKGRIS